VFDGKKRVLAIFLLLSILSVLWIFRPPSYDRKEVSSLLLKVVEPADSLKLYTVMDGGSLVAEAYKGKQKLLTCWIPVDENYQRCYSVADFQSMSDSLYSGELKREELDFCELNSDDINYLLVKVDEIGDSQTSRRSFQYKLSGRARYFIRAALRQR